MSDKPVHTHGQLKQLGADKVMQAKAQAQTRQYPTREQLQLADEHIGIMQVICGVTAKGQEFYAYVSFRLSKYEEFVTKSMNGEKVNLEDYGEILRKGHGLQPSEDVRQFMEETYGFDHNYMEKLAAEVAKKRLQKQQDK